MASRRLRLTLFFFIIFFFFFFFNASSLGQGAKRTSEAASAHNSDSDRDSPDHRAEWMRRGREAPAGQAAAALRLGAHRRKMAIRAQRESLNATAAGESAPITAGWVALGPAPLVSDNNFFGVVSGRATSVAIDPSDPSGNTVYLGGAYGGVWKSTNATASPAGSVIWTPVTDQQPSLATGAVSVQPDGTVVLVGTGEPDNAIDSYYGVGILRSTDAGATWNLVESADGGNHPFAGLGVAKFAWSKASGQTGTVVAAMATTAKGFKEGKITGSTNRGLYRSADGGQTWAYQALPDGGPISATDVVYDAIAGTFFAAVRSHGLYTSADGTNWIRPANQPAVLTSSCSAQANCPIYRGQLAVVPGRDEVYLWFINIDANDNMVDEGIWRSISGGAWSRISESGLTNCGDVDGCGVSQAFYNLEIAAVPDGNGVTDLYAGAVNLYKCKLLNSQTSCSTVDANLPSAWLNLTHVYGFCSSKARVHPDEHGLDFSVVNGKAILYFANDGGIYRALDGYTGLNIGSCNTAGDNQFDNLNGTLGSLTQFVSFSVHPTDPDTVMGGTQDNGSPASNAATSNPQWSTVNGGDGGYNAINPANPNQWFTANTNVSIQACNSGFACNTNAFIPVVTNDTVGGDTGPFYTPYILDPQNSGEFLVGTCRVWRGSTAGTAYSALSVNFDVLSNSTCTGNEFNLVRGLAAFGPKQGSFSSVVYATTEGSGPNCTGVCGGPAGGEVWSTTNAANTLMSNVTGAINPLHYTISSAAVDTSMPSGQIAYIGLMGFVGDGNAHIFKTTDAGQTWTPYGSTANGLVDSPVNALLVDSSAGQIYAATDVGVFVSPIGPTVAASWTEVGPDPAPGVTGYLPNVPVSAIRLFNFGGLKKLRVSTYGRGIWELDLVATQDYQIAVSNSPLDAFPSTTAIFNGTLTSVKGYADPVTLSCGSGAPGDCTFPLGNPIVPTAGGAAFSVSMDSGVATTDYDFTVHGVGGDPKTITHDAGATLRVVDFDLTAPVPDTITAQQGGLSNSTMFQVTGSGAFSASVALTCQGSVINAGATCNFLSATAHPTSGSPVDDTLTIFVPAGVAVNNYDVSIQANSPGAPAPKKKHLTLAVIAPVPDFAIAVNASPSAALARQTATWNGTASAVNGYNHVVNLSCIGTQPGTCTLTPASLTPTAGGVPFTVTIGNATTGVFNFTIQGTDGTATRSSSPLTLTVNTDVNIPLTLTNATVQAGQKATTSMDVAPTGAGTFSGPVTFGPCSGLPAGLTCVFSPSNIAAGDSGKTVVISIQTAGPFTGTQRGQNRRPWLQLSLPLAGILLFGLSGRRVPRRYGIIGLCVMLALTGILLGCGGIAAKDEPPPALISVTVSADKPQPIVLYANEAGNTWPVNFTQQQFTAVVKNSTDQTVTWTVAGGSGNGTIEASGLYTAPAGAPNPAAVTVTATAHADPSKSDFGRLNILSPTALGTFPIAVTVTEATQPQAQHVTTFNLTVQ